MADDGKNGEGQGRKDTGEGSRTFHDPHSLFPLGVTKRNQSRGIVIHLTGTEGEWDSLEDDELIFSLDHGEEKPLPAEDDKDLKSQNFHVPLSPSSPGSLGNCSAAPPSFLSPGPPSHSQRPLASLVKSLSTELEPKEGSTLRPRPLLSLVKSISTELSHSEPEVSQSRSDSRLNLHLWKQLTQTKPRGGGDSRTAPPSPSALSPSAEGLKGGFFKMELEDTKRKLSEAMHEPLSSMFSKIMGEDGAGSPKHQSRSTAAHQGRDGSVDTVLSESPVRTGRRPDGDVLPVFDWPSVGARRRPCPVHHQQELEICEDDDMMQVFATEAPRRVRRSPGAPAPDRSGPDPQPPLPCMSLFCVAVLSYGYFILPLGPYVSGLALGLALGFLLGLFLIRIGSSGSANARRPALTQQGEARFPGGFSAEPDVLQGWMNEIQDYDPEIFHPALTHSVFATLQGCSLRLDYPRCNIRRRAAHDDPPQEVGFIKTRCFWLANSKVFLLPAALARKRVWNPKYPICIQLGAEEDRTGSEQNLGSHPAQTSSTQAGAAPPALYLFGRTGREKEEWFRHLLWASAVRDGPRAGRRSTRPGAPSQSVPVPRSRGPSSDDDNEPATPATSYGPAVPCSATGGLSALEYHSYMARLLAAHEATPPCSPRASSTEASPTANTTANTTCTCDQATPPGAGSASWVNALIGRIFWDFLREKQWADAVAHKIQKKLSRIRLPYFMNELTLTELDMGCSMPHIMAASRPEVNHRGLWVQLQLVYTGNLQMTLQTKFNLSKLGRESREETAQSGPEAGGPSCRPVLSVLADSDEESSSAASSDEEELLLSEPHCPAGEKGSVAPPEGGGRTGRKILRFVDKITKSKCFQRAAENEFIRRKFEDLSNTPLLLSVEVRELSGTLVVNIPAPPTDRIWYSFCVPPKLDLHVCPKLGQRELSFCHVSDWIEKKLQDEFQKVFVLPNMDDISVPLMHSGMDESFSSSWEDPAAAHC
ncbi:testis-expressed sequence 2 protein isoform X2 [Poecilia latipinna]|uniref:Testis expressed 2, like n=1 Tax=Poecilia latipinna TaxID=48699 RepID=A0A3B3VM95_9TELE|nr:PREDICTED: testis-expressed sequence 2 protein-like isoform X2 [Poecilia latipinna]